MPLVGFTIELFYNICVTADSETRVDSNLEINLLQDIHPIMFMEHSTANHLLSVKHNHFSLFRYSHMFQSLSEQ